MLMVSATEWMLNWIHSNTTNLWPAVSLDLVLVVGTASLQEGFIDTTTTGDNTNGGSASGVKDFLGTGWQLDSGLASIWVVGDDDGRVTGSFCELTTVTNLHFDRTTGSTFWHISDWEHIANVEGSLVTAVDRLSSGGTFGSDEGLGVLTVFVWVLECNSDEWCTSAWIVDDVLDDTFDKSMSFGKVHGTVFGGALACASAGLEDTASTFTTGSDDTSHL